MQPCSPPAYRCRTAACVKRCSAVHRLSSMLTRSAFLGALRRPLSPTASATSRFPNSTAWSSTPRRPSGAGHQLHGGPEGFDNTPLAHCPSPTSSEVLFAAGLRLMAIRAFRAPCIASARYRADRRQPHRHRPTAPPSTNPCPVNLTNHAYFQPRRRPGRRAPAIKLQILARTRTCRLESDGIPGGDLKAW